MSVSTVKVCIDRVLPDHLRDEAAKRAVLENPKNLPILPEQPGTEPPDEHQLALLTGNLWRPGRTLRVGFMDGDPRVWTKVEQYAQIWTQYANIKFQFVGADPNAEIRISFAFAGSWSYIGTDALVIPRDEPTMNYGWLTPTTDDEEYSRVVLHEFGHALGCIHEHQSPRARIPWDKEAVYAFYAQPPNNWSREEVDHNLFERYSRRITRASRFDPQSIMLYAIPNELTIGDWSVGWNTTLSERDKRFIRKIYPPTR